MLTDPAVYPYLIVAPILVLFLVVMGRIYLTQFREGRKAKHRRFKLEVERIDLSQFADRFKPLSLDPVEMDFEVLNLKRAVVTLSLSQGATKSTFKAILEFRGNTLIVTRSDGDHISADWVVEALDTDYYRRYKIDDMLQPVEVREDSKISHSTV